MELFFNPSGNTKWKVTDDCIYYGNKRIEFIDVISVILVPGVGFIKGELNIKLKGKIFPIRLIFSKKQQDDAQIAEKYIKEKASLKSSKDIEYRKKCNVCGQVFCFTQKDLEIKKANQTLVSIYSLKSLSGSIGGLSYSKFENAKRADAALSRIVDYSKCPKCNSSDLTDITPQDKCIN